MRDILIIEDDPDLRDLLESLLEGAGIRCATAGTGREGLAAIGADPPHAVLLDLLLPDLHGREVLRHIGEMDKTIAVVILTRESQADSVVECMQLGAVDYITKPFDPIAPTRLLTSVQSAIEHGRLRSRVEALAAEARGGDGFDRIVGESEAIRKSVALLRKATPSDVTMLIQGESGTGKEVAARAVHAESPRRSGPFVVVNCGAIPDGLIESALFGHEKGAFTGATERHIGHFERAHGGTIFLDEIGELRLDMQVRLLRVLQERSVLRVGGSEPRSIDVRVVAATNRDLREEAAEGRFREDLYYRLAVFPVTLPPLRDRGDDVLRIARWVLARESRMHGKELHDLDPRAATALSTYGWPGNIRELQNVIERAVILEESDRLTLDSLTDDVVLALEGPEGVSAAPRAASVDAGGVLPFKVHERRILQEALDAVGGHVGEAARLLEIGRATLYRKVAKYELDASVNSSI